MRRRPKLLYLVNVDSFFVSHRLHLGIAAREAGFDVTVAAGETNAREVIQDAGLRFVPIPIYAGGRSPRHELETAAAVVALYRRERPDLVHHVTIKPILYGSLAAGLAGISARVNAVTGLGYVFMPQANDGIVEHALRYGVRQAYRRMLRGRHVRNIFQNPEDHDALADAGVVDRAASRLVRGSGVDVDVFRETPLPEGRPVVLFPARLVKYKGVLDFVDAARILKAQGTPAEFVLVGPSDPTHHAGIDEDTIRGWEREGVVTWWGPRPKKEMPELLAKAHLVALASYREGLPLVLAEAGACGRAALATDAPGLREIVQAGRSGWLAPVQDPRGYAAVMAEALSDREELARRGKEGRRIVVEGFSRQHVAKATLAIYEELLAGRAHG